MTFYWIDWRSAVVVGLALAAAVSIYAAVSYLTRNRSS